MTRSRELGIVFGGAAPGPLVTAHGLEPDRLLEAMRRFRAV